MAPDLLYESEVLASLTRLSLLFFLCFFPQQFRHGKRTLSACCHCHFEFPVPWRKVARGSVFGYKNPPIPSSGSATLSMQRRKSFDLISGHWLQRTAKTTTATASATTTMATTATATTTKAYATSDELRPASTAPALAWPRASKGWPPALLLIAHAAYPTPRPFPLCFSFSPPTPPPPLTFYCCTRQNQQNILLRQFSGIK